MLNVVALDPKVPKHVSIFISIIKVQNLVDFAFYNKNLPQLKFSSLSGKSKEAVGKIPGTLKKLKFSTILSWR